VSELISKGHRLSIQTVPGQESSRSKELTDAFEKDVPLEVLRLMAGSTVMACGKGLVDQAQTIVDGLTPHFSKHMFVALLRSVLNLAAGRRAEALQVVEHAMKSNPRDDSLLCMCASMRKDLGTPGWRGLAQCVVDRGEDADAVRIAEALLAEPEVNRDKMAVPSAKAALAGLRFASPG
jgi:predicted Zn-dependent protease